MAEENEQGKPKSFRDAVTRMNVPAADDAGDEPGSVVIEDVDPEAAAHADLDPDAAPLEAKDTLPSWVMLPEGLKLPRGRLVFAMRFRAEWTDRPDLGERQCIMWNLTEAEEKLALKRAKGDGLRAMDELAKQMIHAIDGAKADWSKPGITNPSTFFTDIGGKCRQQVKNLYAKNHTMDQAEIIDFLANCVAVRTADG